MEFSAVAQFTLGTVFSSASDAYGNSTIAGLFFSLLLLPTVLGCLLVPIILIRRACLIRLRLPPGPPALPLVGHLHLLGSNTHHSLSELSKKYGPLMFLRFGSVPVVVASSPSMARLLLQTHDQSFAGRAQTAVSMEILGCKDVLFSQPGPYLKLIRQICVTDLLGCKRLESFRPLIAEELQGLLCSVLMTNSDAVPLRAKLYDATCSMITRMTISKRLQESAGMDVQALVLEVIQLGGVFNVGDFMPWLAWMDLQGCVRQSKIVGQRLRAVLQEIIDERRDARARGPRQDVDFLDVLLSSASAPNKDCEITDLNIVAVLADMFGAGIDTSTVTIEWAFAELLTHPLTMRKLQDELEKVVGASRLVEESDIQNLSYLIAVVKETMRLHPALPLLVPHMASQQCQISGFDIPSNTQAFVNVWAIGRDPTIWDKPLDFYPERFLNSKIDVRGQHFQLLPFGSGRRSCPGLILGLKNVHLMLANLLHAFHWTASGAVDKSEKFSLVTTLAKPLVVKAELKAPRHLIEACS